MLIRRPGDIPSSEITPPSLYVSRRSFIREAAGYAALAAGSPGSLAACDRAEAVNEISIIEGGLAETADACWCCAPDGEACAPGNQTGLGKAFRSNKALTNMTLLDRRAA